MLILLLLMLAAQVLAAVPIYCSSYCVDTWACWNNTNQGCMACIQSIFQLEPHDTKGCQILNQTQIVVMDLQGTIDLSTFSTNSPAPYNCTPNFPLSGNYGKGGYLAKKYTLPSVHWQVRIRFNIAYMGSWSTSDMLSLSIDGSPFIWNYTCMPNTSLCTATDCFAIKQFFLNHTESTVFLNFSSSMTKNPPIQSWGIKDILVVTKNCHSSCQKCFGPKNSSCLKCVEGFYLLGNTCVQSCPFFTVQEARMCFEECPDRFYANQTYCLRCHDSCASCTGPESQQCIVDQNKATTETFSENRQFWIFVIILAICIVILLIYTMYNRKSPKVVDEATLDLQKKIMNTQANLGTQVVNHSRVGINDSQLHIVDSKMYAMQEETLNDVQEIQLDNFNRNMHK